MSRRRPAWGAIAAGGVLVAAGFAIAAVEMLRLPKGSVWVVVAVALLLLVLVRRLTR
jgi:hypothetical protein